MDSPQHFNNRRNIETSKIVTSLSALAHPARLQVFQALAKSCPESLSAGELAEILGIAPNTLTFHLKELTHAGLINSERQGRSIQYKLQPNSVQQLFASLQEDCCQGRPELCAPEPSCSSKTHCS